MKYLGLDLGSKSLGIAISDQSGLIARSYKTIKHDEDYEFLVNEVVEIVKSMNIEGIVLGFPKNMNNTIGPRGELSIDFKERLKTVLDIPIYLQDERLSTKSAEDVLIRGNVSRKKRKNVVDSLAATIILQTYLDGREKSEKK